mmetsp:Transcript_26432/g.66185  ORF Transcript_26432/g.66185 Transcript_26432/m.66185 type:complete len:226 (+) Transcript_26432:58-735(+)
MRRIDSLRFRDAVFASLALPAPFFPPRNSLGAPTMSFRLPPRALGLFQRNPKSRRRFSDPSRVHALLAELCRAAAPPSTPYAFVELAFHEMDFEEQVRRVAAVGVGVGIHGANLVNAVFMPPFAALVEVFPFRYVRAYYVGGSNAGLRYSGMESSSGPDLRCNMKEVSCRLKYREQKIVLSDDDFRILESRVVDAISYVEGLWQAPSGNIPVVRDGLIYKRPTVA